MTRSQILDRICAERNMQDADQWGVDNDKTLSIADWLLIIKRRLEKAELERMLEMCALTPRGARDIAAYVEQTGATPNSKKQIMKVAAMCVAALESLPD